MARATHSLEAAPPQQPTATSVCCDMPLELSAITSLRLWEFAVGLGTLTAFTSLQRLALSSTTPAGSGPGISALLHPTHLHVQGAEGAVRLPLQCANGIGPEVAGLLQLTHLTLAGGCAEGAVLASLHSLTRLQELEVRCYPANGLTALPVSLTKLCLRAPWCTVDAQGNAAEVLGENSSVLAALTGLRWLEVDGVGVFSAAVLRGMTSLQHLTVRGALLRAAAAAAGEVGQQQQQLQQEEGQGQGDEEQGAAAASSASWVDSWNNEFFFGYQTNELDGEGAEEEEEVQQGGGDEGSGVGLTVLNRLKQLQHLELCLLYPQPNLPSKADVAALTASSQLTCLMMDGELVKQRHYRHMFFQGRRLRELKGLQATMSLVGDGRNAAAVVRCCPYLEWIDVTTGG